LLIVKTNSILGGIPYYLQQFDDFEEVCKAFLFAECKWQNKEVGIKVYEDLKEKSGLVNWYNEDRKEYFALFSKAGVTSGFNKDGVLLFDLTDINDV